MGKRGSRRAAAQAKEGKAKGARAGCNGSRRPSGGVTSASRATAEAQHKRVRRRREGQPTWLGAKAAWEALPWTR